ncbi:ethylbenzene dehydrogenase-related protein [Candidatus Amarobacter glycogenicus]|uniref:ethylbenzene dehydrogenase-related protein n=1 Tax=Candidatus Amarobacter glycogenicus TaxID=3140699 RepID=UPI00313712BB|nr:molecular chaperone TorD family protein [Dehalococcoidia bacterium]
MNRQRKSWRGCKRARASHGSSREGSERDYLETVYISLTTFSSSPDAPAFESAYFGGDAQQQTQRMADIAGFYRAFGVDSTDGGSRPDELPVQLELRAYLCRKEAYAEEHLGAPRAGQTRKAQRLFLEEHLGRWGAAFGRRVASQAPAGHFYQLAGETLSYWVLQECSSAGVTPVEVSLVTHPGIGHSRLAISRIRWRRQFRAHGRARSEVMKMLHRLANHRRAVVVLVAALAVGGLLQLTNTNPAVSQSQYINAYEVSKPAWTPMPGSGENRQRQHPLTAQAGQYIAGGSVTAVKAQAVHPMKAGFTSASWSDSTKDEATLRAQDFSDAVALEFPASGETAVPAICMGQADAAVNIWHWRADSNAGLKDPNQVYTSAQIDGYPYTDSLFYTAREAGNPFANPDLGAVQSLYSRAFGELTTLANQDVQGMGKHTADGWSVVFARDFASINPGHASFAASTTVDMAFAVWDGDKDERNGRKAVSQLVTMNIGAADAFEDGGSNLPSCSSLAHCCS